MKWKISEKYFLLAKKKFRSERVNINVDILQSYAFRFDISLSSKSHRYFRAIFYSFSTFISHVKLIYHSGSHVQVYIVRSRLFNKHAKDVLWIGFDIASRVTISLGCESPLASESVIGGLQIAGVRIVKWHFGEIKLQILWHISCRSNFHFLQWRRGCYSVISLFRIK